jgi:hypothetical protein
VLFKQSWSDGRQLFPYRIREGLPVTQNDRRIGPMKKTKWNPPSYSRAVPSENVILVTTITHLFGSILTRPISAPNRESRDDGDPSMAQAKDPANSRSQTANERLQG